MEEQTGRKVNLSMKGRVTTPFLPGDNKEAPAGRPLGDGFACLCPHCLASFPVWGGDERPPRGIGPLGGWPLAFGSPIYHDPGTMPTFRAEDLKKRAMNVEEWCQNFMEHALPRTTTPPAANAARSIADSVQGVMAPSGFQSATDEEIMFANLGCEDGHGPRGQFGQIACSILMRILMRSKACQV